MILHVFNNKYKILFEQNVTFKINEPFNLLILFMIAFFIYNLRLKMFNNKYKNK